MGAGGAHVDKGEALCVSTQVDKGETLMLEDDKEPAGGSLYGRTG